MGAWGVVLGHRPPDPAIRWAIATIPAEVDPVDYCSTIFDPEIGDWVSGAEVADLLVDSFQ